MYRYLGILETDYLKEKEVRDPCSKEYKGRMKLVLKTKLSRENKITAANTWAVAIQINGTVLVW